MVNLKTEKEIETMTRAGEILRRVYKEVKPGIIPGITTGDIEKKTKELIYKYGGEGSFDKVPGYKWVTCLPINEQIVHTPPTDRVIADGDVLTVDMGVFLGGYHTDFADTFIVGTKKDPETVRFLKKGEETLKKALKLAAQGRRIGEISKLIQSEIEGAGYHIVKPLTGHGLGKTLHEEPMVPGFLHISVEKTYKMQPGLTIAIEVIYGKTTGEMKHVKGDSWTIITADGGLSAQFEHTVAITDKNTCILT
jgi:methionyl aminopeptidase